MSEKLYVGLDEHNENEGETFGYFFEKTDESTGLMRAAEAQYDRICAKYGQPGTPINFHYEITEAELNALEKFDENGYMGRVNRCGGAGPMLALKMLGRVTQRDTPYKGSFSTQYTSEDDWNSGYGWFDLRTGPDKSFTWCSYEIRPASYETWTAPYELLTSDGEKVGEYATIDECTAIAKAEHNRITAAAAMG